MPPVWLLFVLVCAVWVFWLVRPFRTSVETRLDARSRLIEEKRGYLFAIRDAELDFQSGKLNPADYEQIRGALEKKTLAVMRQLDAQAGGEESPRRRVEARS